MKHIVSFSGGKDSTALVMWAIENLKEFDSVYCDTHWESPILYEYLEYVNKEYLGGELIYLYSQKYSGFEDLCIKKGRVPSAMARYCTEELKVKPMVDYLASIEGEKIVYDGIRAQESPRRAKMKQEAYHDLYKCMVHHPLFYWTHEEVFSIQQKHGCKPNPLYSMGMARVGCMPCIMARHGELKQIAKRFPESIDRVRELEKKIGRTFFSAGTIPDRACKDVDPKTNVPIAFIDNIVEYLNGDPEQQEILTDEDLCMSYYGLCGI